MSTSSLKLNLRDKIDSISFKVLDDSNPDALFKGIDKMLYIDGRFYILDCMGTSSVLVFDDNGNFLFKVGDFGQGPGEYNSITDFDVNNGYIYILDSKKRMIFSYDLDGKLVKYYSYLNKIMGVNDLIVTDDGNFLLGMDVELNSNDQVLLTDTNFIIKEKILSFEKNVTRNHLNIGNFRRCGKDIVYYFPVSETFYIFDLYGEVKRHYKVLLDDELPINLKKDYVKLSDKREELKLSYFYKTPFIWNDFLVSEVFYKSKHAIVCADLSGRCMFMEEYSLDSPISLSEIKYPIYMDENKVVCLYNSVLNECLDETSQLMLNKIDKGALGEEDFILIIYHLSNE